MKHTVVGIFENSKVAGAAVSELHELGYAKDISVIAKDVNEEGLQSHQIKSDKAAEAARGAAKGSVIGGTIGAIAGLLAGAAIFTIPGAGIAVLGPAVAAFAGAGLGGGAGTLLGALIDMGIPEDRAKDYEKYVQEGEVLIAVSVDPKHVDEVETILTRHQDRETKENADYSSYAVYSY